MPSVYEGPSRIEFGLLNLFAAWCLQQTLFDTYLAGAMGYMRQHMKELVPTMDNNIAESCMRILDCYLDPFHLRSETMTCLHPLESGLLTDNSTNLHGCLRLWHELEAQGRP
eukprot:33139-Eustigmatos_ZCMA.PRE.1